MTDDELKRQFDALRQENAAAHADTRQEFKDTVSRLSAENRQYLEVATEAFKGQVQLIAEKVIGVTEELRRDTAVVRQEMRTGLADTLAMIRQGF